MFIIAYLNPLNGLTDILQTDGLHLIYACRRVTDKNSRGRSPMLLIQFHHQHVDSRSRLEAINLEGLVNKSGTGERMSFILNLSVGAE